MAFNNVIITGMGSYIPSRKITNKNFAESSFFTNEQERVYKPSVEIAEKLQEITGIEERRYVKNSLCCSDIGFRAAQKAIEDAGIDPETIDQIIFAHNFGDVEHGSKQSDMIPSLAARAKHLLGIENPNCVAYDILFGCPGWVQGMQQAYAFIKSGIAKTCLVIGSETLSRVVDPYDRDTMIFADGAGAAVVQLKEEDKQRGILSIASQSYTKDEAYYLYYGASYNPAENPEIKYIKMHGRKIYELGLSKVPPAMKQCLDESGTSIDDLKKIFIHQANEKMDEAMVKRFYRQYKKPVPEAIMPMNIHKLGNSSVATVPTVYDMVLKGELEGHEVQAGDVILFASIGSGMHINAITYKS
ncbi:MAG: ketoacyl-ACP synthase III [Saprospiraceae bacterium]|nr:ketoacyl-ACP synthase III [Saprospiraceae bacterium]